MAQRERHLLITTVLGPLAIHGYLVRRDGAAEARGDLTWATNQVCNTTEKIAKDNAAPWMPIILSTDLDAKTGREVQALIKREAGPAMGEPLKKYLSREENLFFAAWVMDQAAPECEKLMSLH